MGSPYDFEIQKILIRYTRYANSVTRALIGPLVSSEYILPLKALILK